MADVTQSVKVPVGPATILGLLAAAGTAASAVAGNDPAAVIGGILTALTMIGRYAQAVAILRPFARAAKPYVDTIAELPDQPPKPGR